MNIKLNYFTPLEVVQERLLETNTPEYLIDHIFYNFHIEGISRACLQEMMRHRHRASPSVKSTRYTLKELKQEEPFITLPDYRNSE